MQQAICPERRSGFDSTLSAVASVTEVQASIEREGLRFLSFSVLQLLLISMAGLAETWGGVFVLLAPEA